MSPTLLNSAIAAAAMAILTLQAFSQSSGYSLSPASRCDFIAGVIKNVSDSAVASTIRSLEAFHHRYWEGVSRDSVVLWIQDAYRKGGVSDVTVDGFNYYQTQQKNVIATIPGSTLPANEIIVGGHYDVVWNQIRGGADDNASGTAAVIEMARVLRASNYTPRSTLRFIAFAAEEVGLKGSNDYATKARAANRQIVLMMNFDMIGYRDKTQPDRDAWIVQYPGSEQEAWLDSLLMRRYTTLTPVRTTTFSEASDSWSFYSQGYKAIFNMEADVNPYRHYSGADTSGNLDFAYAGDIIRSALALLLTIDSQVTSAEEQLARIPKEFALHQSYPNPFNSLTTIRFDVPRRSAIKVRILDVLGREVALLADDVRDPGSYSIPFAGRKLSSGVYFYQLETGAIRLARKMMLIR